MKQTKPHLLVLARIIHEFSGIFKSQGRLYQNYFTHI
jgi:hypothetical protein